MKPLAAILCLIALASCASKTPPRALIPPRAEISRLDVAPVVDAGRATRDAVRGVADAGASSREASRKLSDTSRRLSAEITRAESLAQATVELTAALASVRALADELEEDVGRLSAALAFAQEKEKVAIGTVIAGGSTRRRRFYAYPDIAIVNLGLNDVRASVAAATIMANLQTLYRELLAGGVKEIWQCTITPDTSAGAQEAIRIALNALIRACPNPLTGIIECADAMETSRDSGVWISGYNAVDNYHPNNTGAAVLRDLLRSTLNLA